MGPELVSEQSELEILKRQDAEGVKVALRTVTANLLRIVRGAGSPRLVGQLSDCVEALLAYQESHGHSPPFHHIQGYLDPEEASLEHRPWTLPEPAQLAEWEADGSVDRKYALEQIRRGALQVAASKLLGQSTHEAAGRSELFQGTRALAAAQDKYRKHMLETAKSYTSARKKRKKG